VECSCELGNESLGSIKCWELPSGCTTCGLSSGTQLHRVSYLVAVDQSVEFACGLRAREFVLFRSSCTHTRVRAQYALIA
jgi:hypothetical protein